MKAEHRLCAGKWGVLSPCINRYQYPSCETAHKGRGINYGATKQMRIAPKMEGPDFRNSLSFYCANFVHVTLYTHPLQPIVRF